MHRFKVDGAFASQQSWHRVSLLVDPLQVVPVAVHAAVLDDAWTTPAVRPNNAEIHSTETKTRSRNILSSFTNWYSEQQYRLSTRKRTPSVDDMAMPWGGRCQGISFETRHVEIASHVMPLLGGPADKKGEQLNSHA